LYYGRTNHQPDSVRQIAPHPFAFSICDYVVFSLEEALLKALPSLLPNLLGTTKSPRVEFYDKFQSEADGYDRDFMNKYDEDLNTTLIFVSVFFHIHLDRGIDSPFRPVCSPRSHPLSFSTFRESLNRIFKE